MEDGPIVLDHDIVIVSVLQLQNVLDEAETHICLNKSFPDGLVLQLYLFLLRYFQVFLAFLPINELVFFATVL